MTYEESIAAMYDKAKTNLAKFGQQPFITLIEAMAEELGELAQAFLQFKYDNKPKQRIVEESQDLGALCLQFDVENTVILDNIKYEAESLFNAKFAIIDLLTALANLTRVQGRYNGEARCLSDILCICAHISHAYSQANDSVTNDSVKSPTRKEN